MSKVKSNSLFNLIRSLSKSEKWQFKVYSSRFNFAGSKKFVVLFDAIEKQKEYNEEELYYLKGIKPAQLPNLKVNLYKQLLNSLATKTHHSADSLVNRYVDHARFLYNKCLYADCLIILEKAKKMARDNFQPVLLLELLEIEKAAIWQTSDEKIAERTNKLVAETQDVANQIKTINQFSNLAVQLTTFYQRRGFIRNDEDLKKVQAFYNSHFQKVNPKYLSDLEKIHLYYTVTVYYFYVQDFNNGYKYAKKWLDVFEKNPLLIKAKTELYIKALNNVLVAQNKLQLYDDFKLTHNKLTHLKRRKDIIFTDNLELNLFKAIYIHEINRHFMLGEFRSGTRIVNALEKELMNFIPKLNKHTIVIFYYKIACLYFGSHQFKTAIKWLNKIINEKESGLREDLQAFSRILRLISYYELNDREMIEYNIRSTYRFLQKKQNFVKYQLLIMKFLRSIKKTDTHTETISRFSSLKKAMQKLEKDKFEKRAFIYFDMVSWLESKIANQPMQDIVKVKLKHLPIRKAA